MCDVFGAEVEVLINGLSGQQIKDEIGLRSRRFSVGISMGGEDSSSLFEEAQERGIFGQDSLRVIRCWRAWVELVSSAVAPSRSMAVSLSDCGRPERVHSSSEYPRFAMSLQVPCRSRQTCI
jgi:hypothetical protein